MIDAKLSKICRVAQEHRGFVSRVEWHGRPDLVRVELASVDDAAVVRAKLLASLKLKRTAMVDRFLIIDPS